MRDRRMHMLLRRPRLHSLRPTISRLRRRPCRTLRRLLFLMQCQFLPQFSLRRRFMPMADSRLDRDPQWFHTTERESMAVRCGRTGTVMRLGQLRPEWACARPDMEAMDMPGMVMLEAGMLRMDR